MLEHLLSAVYIIAGLFILNYGAEWLVKGASHLARRFGISPLVIGLTVVAFGTSSPELFTSLIGGSTITVGNVVGSNLLNIGLILGITAVIFPLTCQAKFLRFEMPLMVALGPVLWLSAANGIVSRVEGVVLFVMLVAFIVISIRRSETEPENEKVMAEIADVTPAVAMPLGKSILLVLAGLGGLLLGAKLLLDGAINIAEALGIPERVIALTLVAAGTSLPELATSIVAARKGEGDIALGNIVGSNIFNILGIVGLVAIVRPIDLPPGSLGLDIPAMIVMQALCVPIMLTGYRIVRSEGAVLLGAYAAYVAVLLLQT